RAWGSDSYGLRGRRMVNSYHVQSTLFSASLGMEVSIQIAETEMRFKSTLVGMQCNQYLLVPFPVASTVSQHLQDGTDLILRYVHFGSVYGCMVTLIGLIRKPFPLLFLSVPTQVQRIELRKVQRVACLIPGTVMRSKGKHSGMIQDISSGGVLFSTQTAQESGTSPFEVGESILVSFPLLGMEGHQEFPGKIRRVTEDREKVSLGIEFEEYSTDIREKIESYIEKINTYQEG
ncbi:MAG: flagellar brake protein, partial [Desulfobacteraceae bacterium]